MNMIVTGVVLSVVISNAHTSVSMLPVPDTPFCSADSGSWRPSFECTIACPSTMPAEGDDMRLISARYRAVGLQCGNSLAPRRGAKEARGDHALAVMFPIDDSKESCATGQRDTRSLRASTDLVRKPVTCFISTWLPGPEATRRILHPLWYSDTISPNNLTIVSN